MKLHASKKSIWVYFLKIGNHEAHMEILRQLGLMKPGKSTKLLCNFRCSVPYKCNKLNVSIYHFLHWTFCEKNWLEKINKSYFQVTISLHTVFYISKSQFHCTTFFTNFSMLGRKSILHGPALMESHHISLFSKKNSLEQNWQLWE